MTTDEMNRLAEAMKKEEFRKLLVEYAEEISDPKNRQLYEEEITKLEQERGSNVVFIHPEPGYCIKTTQDGQKKCFINISKNANIEKPTSHRGDKSNQGANGLMWSIPHTCSQPRPDTDNSGKNECVVYDVVFHPDAYRMGETNNRFDQLLKDSAFETIETNFKVKLDRANAKVLKNMKFKGRPAASIIRTKASKAELNETKKPAIESKNNDDMIGDMIDKLKHDYMNAQAAQTKPAQPEQKKPVTKKLVEEVPVESVDAASKYTVPTYKIVHRGTADIHDFSAQLDNTIVTNTRPKELAISIDLPLCKSSADLILDIFEKRLYLESNEPNYKLDLPLSHPVNEKEAKAKFDKSKRCLNVTLPVLPFVAKVNLVEKLVVQDENNNLEDNHSIKYELFFKFNFNFLGIL
jgi:dynein assembly factor 2